MSLSKVEIVVDTRFMVYDHNQTYNDSVKWKFYEVVVFYPALTQLAARMVTIGENDDGGVIVCRWGGNLNKEPLTLDKLVSFPHGGKILVKKFHASSDFLRHADRIARDKFDRGYRLKEVSRREYLDYHLLTGFRNLFSRAHFAGHYTLDQRCQIVCAIHDCVYDPVCTRTHTNWHVEALADYLGVELDALRRGSEIITPEPAQIEIDHGPNWGDWGSFVK
jgi:hypothetical protein